MDYLAEFFRGLYDSTGFNFSVLYDPYDRDRWLIGMKTTLLLAAWSVAFSLIIGLVGAILHQTGNPLLRWLTRIYVHVFRNTPPLAQLYFFYFAVSPLLSGPAAGGGAHLPVLGNFAWAIISLSLLQGAFSLEIFRSGFDAVPDQMREAADALGIRRSVQLFKIKLPLAFRLCLPALQGNIVNSIKTTSLAYAIAVPEMLYAANQIWSDRVNVAEMMLVMLLSYVALVGLVGAGLSWLERKLALPGFGER